MSFIIDKYKIHCYKYKKIHFFFEYYKNLKLIKGKK